MKGQDIPLQPVATEPIARPSPYESPNQFTWRASIVGSFLGCFVGASNLYLGLKVGWVFSAGIFGAAFTFILIKLAIRFIPRMCPHFSIQENCIAQTAATTSGGLNVGFITCIPAMYRLNLLSASVVDDVGRLYLWTISAATYGMFFAIPFRKWFVVRKEYPFPSPRATAETIKLLHATTGDDIPPLVKRQGALMLTAFLASLFSTIASHWITLFEEMRILYWLGVAFSSDILQTLDKTWGWYLSPSLPLIGSGFIIPLNVNFSFVLGAVICYGISGPVLVNNGFLVGATGFKAEGNGTAQSLFLWGGIALMLFSSLTEVLLSSSTATELCLLVKTIFNQSRDFALKLFRMSPTREVSVELESETLSVRKDPVPDSEQILTSWWVLGLMVSMIANCSIMAFSFRIAFYQTLLSVVFAFLLGIVAVQSAAETDINPVSTLSKVVQVVFSAFPAPTVADLQRSNLLCALVTAAGVAQSADMVSDLKTGDILETSPRAQFYAQLVGTAFGVAYMVPLFILYASAYPCIVQEMDSCEFGISGVLGWQNTTLLLTRGLEIPAAAKYIAIACSISAVLLTTIRLKYTPSRYHCIFPNLNAVGVGFILPQPATPIAMALGGIISFVWSRTHPESHKNHHLVVGAGAMAGAGISAALKAALTLANVPSNVITFASIPKK